jgi:hypothetical protein
MSAPIMMNGAAKNPNANKRNGTKIARTRICFFEIKTPTKTPSNIRLIDETNRMKTPTSLPNTLSNLRKSKNKYAVKTHAQIHNSFVKVMRFQRNTISRTV